MVTASATTVLDTPTLQDNDGDSCALNESHSFRVAHTVTHPSYYLVTDEVGRSIIQKGDGHIRSAKLLCEKGPVPKKRRNK